MARSWLSIALTVLLAFASMPSLTSAADTITDLSFDTTADSISVYAADSPYYLNLYAAYASVSTKMDVTDSATWKSTNTAVAKVSQGAITGIAKGTAKISATYGGYTKSITVNVDDMYDTVTIKVGTTANAPDEDSVKLGQTVAYALSGTKSGSSFDLTDSASWSSSNSAVATVDEGELTLLAEGTTTITASYMGKSDTIKLAVTSPYSSITLSGSDTLEFTAGDADVTLLATAQLLDGSTDNVADDAEWTSSNASVATVDAGTITPVGAGTATITASYLGASDTVTVVVRPGAQELKLTPGTDFGMQLRDTPVSLTAQALSFNDTVTDVTNEAEWSSSDLVVATVSKGVVTPKAAGTATIKAAYKGISRSIKVTVYPSISTMTTSESDQTVETYIGQTGTLPQVTATSFSGDTVNVASLLKWQSSNTAVVSITDSKWKALSAGTAVLSATINNITVSVTVTVNEKPLTLLPEYTTLSVVIGKEIAFPKVTVVYENGEEEDVTDKVKWKSSSTNLVVQASSLKGLAASSAALTGTYLNKTVKISVTVEEEVVKLVADATSLTLNPGKSKSIKVTATYKSGKTAVVSTKVNWSTNNEAVADFSSKNVVKAIKVGTAVVTGTMQAKSVTIAINVVPKLKTFVVSETALKLAVGDTHTLKVKAFYDDGTFGDKTAVAEWTSSNSSVASVEDGVITAKAKGSATIRAKFEGKTVSVRVTVK